MFFLNLLIILSSFTAFAQENNSVEKIKIDLKIELPKNSLLNLILKASSGDSAECVQQNSSRRAIISEKTTTSKEKILASPELKSITNVDIPHSTTTSILFIRKLIKFCALDTNENSSVPLPLWTHQPSVLSSTPTPSTTSFLVDDIQPNLMPIEDQRPEKTTDLPVIENKQCPENFRNYENRCIYVSAEFNNWYEARVKCEELKSRLIIPDTIFTFERVLLPVAYELSQDFWINAYFNVEFDEWLYPLIRFDLNFSDTNQTNDLAFENAPNSQMIYIDPDENKEWFCNSHKLKSYSSVGGEPKDNYLAMSWSEEFGRNCIDNFNLNSTKRVVCELV